MATDIIRQRILSDRRDMMLRLVPGKQHVVSAWSSAMSKKRAPEVGGTDDGALSDGVATNDVIQT